MTREARELMRRAGVSPDTRNDQHFLVDDRVLDRIADYAPDAGSALEIGGGVGNLTSRLVGKYDEVHVVEIDTRLADFLRDEFPGADVVHGDAVDVELPDFDVCVSNLPYSASSPLLFRLLPRRRPMVLTLQKEFADRLVADVGDDDYGRLSVTAGYYADSEILETVPPGAFEPPPAVESAVVRTTPAEPLHVDDEEFFMDFVRGVFTQRRKTLRNAIRNSSHITGVDPAAVGAVDEELLSKRPGEMTPSELAEAAEAVRRD